MNRIVTLDYLRGIAACIVMAGHYYGWIFDPEPPIVLSKLVTFSVSIFYILSGITLYSVYHRSFKINFQSFYSFVIKRVFRILPLLWIATTLTILLTHINPSWRILFYNYTGLFGFIAQRGGIARAAWSIGNEMCFYIVFPFFIYLAQRRNKAGLYLWFIFTALIAIYISIFVMKGATFTKPIFNYYIHPLNHLFLFVGGIVIASYFKYRELKYSNFTLAALVLLFLFYNIDDRMDMFISYHRFFLALICFGICIVLYINRKPTIKHVHKPLNFLGDTSYSIYLLHPIVFLIISKFSFNPIFSFFVCILTTLLFSFLVYRFIEVPASNFGKRVSQFFGTFSITGTKTG